MKEERGLVRGIFYLAIVLLVGAYVAARWWPSHNYRRFSSDVETGVNRALFDSGIFDHQIQSRVLRERSRWGLVWIEADRRVEPASETQVKAAIDRLREVARSNYCQFDRRRERDGTLVEIHHWEFVFQRVTFLKPAPPRPVKPSPAPLKRAPVLKGPSVAIVVDDVAYNVELLDRFASLGVPLTFAILPRDKHSKAIAEKANAMQFAVILHLPMQPIDLEHNNPGGAGLYLEMTPEQLHEQFEKDVASVPHIVGINNHMGSAFTENREKMMLVLQWVKEKGLFFLDSHTSEHSVAPKVAKELGVRCRVNQTFLDNSDTVEGIEKELDGVMKLALKNHSTIAIGHYRRKHLLEALQNKIPEFRARGIQFVTLPSLYPRQ